jgi:FtsH-binding integral membrane protein
MSPTKTPTQARAGTTTYDAGLRAHMQRIYNRMTLGVLATALTAYIVSATPALMTLFLGGPQAYLVMFAPLIILWTGFKPETMSPGRLRIMFFLISVLYGLSFSTIFLAYANADIARAFFVATGMFAGLSAFGYVTKKNLDGLGAFCVMGMWGVLLLGLVHVGMNAFGHQAPVGMVNVIDIMAILAFSGITAWQTQAMKEMYSARHGDDANNRAAWSAALTLYVSFIALFMHILRFMSNNR